MDILEKMEELGLQINAAKSELLGRLDKSNADHDLKPNVVFLGRLEMNLLETWTKMRDHSGQTLPLSWTDRRMAWDGMRIHQLNEISIVQVGII